MEAVGKPLPGAKCMEYARYLLEDLEAQGRKAKEPGVAEELKRRLDEYREKLAGLKSQSEGKLDDDAWKGVDTEVQVLAGQLRKTIAEAGLADLLKEISSAGSSNTSAAGSRP